MTVLYRKATNQNKQHGLTTKDDLLTEVLTIHALPTRQ